MFGFWDSARAHHYARIVSKSAQTAKGYRTGTGSLQRDTGTSWQQLVSRSCNITLHDYRRLGFFFCGLCAPGHGGHRCLREVLEPQLRCQA